MINIVGMSPFPFEFSEIDISGYIVIVVDVINSTTTIAAALYGGYKAVIPVRDIDEAFKLAKELNADLAGENLGLDIEGFDFFNSPAHAFFNDKKREYLVLRTTNGTKAISAFAHGNEVYTGALVNYKFVARTVMDQAQKSGKNILIVAAGRLGKKALEDELAAGFLASEFLDYDVKFDGMVKHFLHIYQTYSIEEAFSKSIYVNNALKTDDLMHKMDVFISSKKNIFPVVPKLQKLKINSATVLGFVNVF